MCRDSTLVGIVMAFHRMRRAAGALLYRYVTIKLLVNSEQLQLSIGVGRNWRHPLVMLNWPFLWTSSISLRLSKLLSLSTFPITIPNSVNYKDFY